MEGFIDDLGQSHQEDLLRQYKIEEDLGLHAPVLVLPSDRLTVELLYFKGMEA